jgi:hypothetical protein
LVWGIKKGLEAEFRRLGIVCYEEWKRDKRTEVEMGED